MNRLWRRIDTAVEAPRSPHGAYMLAVLASAVFSLQCLVTSKLFGVHLPFIAGLAAVLLSTAIGGLGPGLLAMTLGLAFELSVRSSLLGVNVRLPNIVAVLIFESCCVGVGELLLRARRDAIREAAKCRSREAYLQSIFDNLPVAMFVIDEAGKICVASAEAGRLFGLAPDAMRDTAIETWVEIALPNGQAEPAGLLRSDAGTVEDAIDGRRADGAALKLRVALAVAATLPVRLFTLSVEDLTEETEHMRRIHDLQDEVARMGRLSALGEMGAGIAHELNQPLTAAANYLNYARRQIQKGGSDNGSSLAEVIEEAAQQVLRAGAVLKRLRGFVSRGGGEHREHDLRAVVNEALLLAKPLLRGARTQLEVEFSPALGPVSCDRVQVQQVLLNLVRNAIEAMRHHSKRTLRISVRRTDEGIVVGVRDSGPGVPAESASRLFSPFNTSKAEGMGMGLAICRTLVESHGGRIWCESPEQGGAEFLFLLPRRVQERADAA